MNTKALQRKALDVREDIVRMLSLAGSGHPGGSLSAADIGTALFFEVMDVDPNDPKKPDRDKFVLSKGHAAPLLYACLAEKGFFPKETLWTLRKMGSILQGHPNMNEVPGVEMSTGSLGQGFGPAVGMAIAGKLDKSKGRVYALLGDGEIQEGIVWEAAMAAAHHKLDNLTIFIDHNGLQIDGTNDEVMRVMPIDEKFRAFGWDVRVIDGHDMDAILGAVKAAKKVKGRPQAIIAETVKGKGVSYMENAVGWHGKAPNAEQTKQALEELAAARAALK
jgi:transketolase